MEEIFYSHCLKKLYIDKHDEMIIKKHFPTTWRVKLDCFLCKGRFNKEYPDKESVIRKEREKLELDVDKQ